MFVTLFGSFAGLSVGHALLALLALCKKDKDRVRVWATSAGICGGISVALLVLGYGAYITGLTS